MSFDKLVILIVIVSLLQLASFGAGFYSGQMLLTEAQKNKIAVEQFNKEWNHE